MKKQLKSKTPQRRRQRRQRLSGLTAQPLIVPSRFTGNMRYSTVLALSPAAGSVATNVFRVNSVYDPDFTGVGGSVVGYSQLSAMYGRYRVLSAIAEVTFLNTSATTPLTCFIAVNPVTTVGISLNQILAQRHVWTRSIGTSTGAASVFHRVQVPVHRIYGVPAAQVKNEDDFAAVTGTNPNNGVYMHVGALPGGGAAGSFNIQVNITYKVVWSLPLELA